jgi:hypothetical protein
MRALTNDTCEMKRLYVCPPFREGGVAGAHRLYERLGFTEIAPYRHNPIVGSRFLALQL